MFTLNATYGQAVINGLGQVLLFATEAEAVAYAAQFPALLGTEPRAVYFPEVVLPPVEQFI
jgi:hypothetical protein